VAGVKIPDRRIPRQVALAMGRGIEWWAARKQKRPLTTYKATMYAVHDHYFDNSKARRELGLPVTPLEATIEKSVRWFRDHGYAA
jgi:dihydroflavonol-4-reductase